MNISVVIVEIMNCTKVFCVDFLKFLFLFVHVFTTTCRGNKLHLGLNGNDNGDGMHLALHGSSKVCQLLPRSITVLSCEINRDK